MRKPESQPCASRGKEAVMKAVNLHILTRTPDHESMSLLLQALSGRADCKDISPHEAATLSCLVRELSGHFLSSPSLEGGAWLPLLDGFYFSYIIEHIGKEFDLLKVSADNECVLNIELKSEEIGEERIRRQLEQNRYYLTHIAHTIYSFTYVMESGAFYCMNDRGYLRRSSAAELAAVLEKPALRRSIDDGIDRFFRASDYLISPVGAPEKFLQGQYFLTNQQFDFRRRILEFLQQERDGRNAPLIAVSGIAGTGKTLLLFDLAMILSRRRQVLLVHTGQLRQGHLIIDERLHNVSICSDASIPAFESMDLSFLLIDEADLMPCQVLESLLDRARDTGIPVILAYDPHHLLLGDAPGEARAEAAPGGAHPEAATGTPQPEPAPGTPHPEPAPGPSAQTIALISRRASLALAFSGNIRVNRPVYNFLRTLLHPKDRAGRPDYSGIDVLCSKSPQETALLAGYYRARGYTRVDFSREAREEIAPEYGRVLLVLDSSFYYDEALFLHAVTQEEGRLKFLYEVLSRTRENLCLIVEGNPSLFLKVLQIRLYA